MFAESVLDAVALDLERRGVLYGSEAVQGNPGPSLDVSMVVEAPTSSEATARASGLVVEALGNAGVESGAYEFDSHVALMSEVERQIKPGREVIEAKKLTGVSHWQTVRVVRSDDMDIPPDQQPRS